MLLANLGKRIFEASEILPYTHKLEAGEDAILAIPGSVRAFWVACQFSLNPKCTICIIPGLKSAQIFARELKSYLGSEKVFEYYEPPRGEFNPVVSAIRNQALFHMCAGIKCVLVAASRDILRKLPDSVRDFCQPLQLSVCRDYDFDSILTSLVEAGYRQYEAIEGPGTFVVRGGVIDIFPANMKHPVRLDFFGDELEEIRRIVLTTGQSTNPLKSVDIFPACDLKLIDIDINRAHLNLDGRARTNKQIREYLANLDERIAFNEIGEIEPFIFKKMISFGSLVPDDALCVVSEPRAIMDECQKYYEEIKSSFSDTSFSSDSLYLEPKCVDFGSAQRSTLVSIMQTGLSVDAKLKVKRPTTHKNIEQLSAVLNDYRTSDFLTLLSVPNSRARQEVCQELVEFEQPIVSVSSRSVKESSNPQLQVVNVTDLSIPMPFVIPAAKIAFLSLSNSPIISQNLIASRNLREQEDFVSDENSSIVHSVTTKYLDITKITFPYKPGDYVVHSFHGIAKFVDLVRRNIADYERDYLLLEYAEGDKLYVPIEQLGRVTRYVGPQGRKPRVTRLGTADWSRAMKKARKATRKMAFDLVDVYSRREIAKGHAFCGDGEAMMAMENDFPYTETFDQMQAICDVKADMESSRPMDRLVCGDVGFGKTEVALRAAFKCVNDGLQVMVLCPTTILASQHYTTFNGRLTPYDIKVDVLSRFKSGPETKEIVEKFNAGKLDVLIGTHRLLSRDINPHNLGLIIIDEEQRFGVAHKEQLKNYRDSIDVLTLSATPIPRTMQMATSGVRDMSLILTPPDDRRAVEVHVGEWDPDLVSDAIRREIDRGGQVYYISNRVRTIKDAVERVGIAAEEARIGVAHGQMQKSQLEGVMEEFSAGNLDVLISTTIVESGIDNPNTNTLIIEDSQNLGLAQMYQLKGRVGRSATQAYAYFLFSDSSVLSEDAHARLTAIDELSDLGSGVQIAMRDLEIRGAGNFLGAEQSGNLSSVGFDLFAQMLKGAIENAEKIGGASNYAIGAVGERGQSSATAENQEYLAPSISDIAVNIPGSAYFPDEYIPDVDERVIWYRRLASATSIDEVYAIESDLLEYNEAIPQTAKNLLLKSRIAGLGVKFGFKVIGVSGGRLVLEGRALTKRQIQEFRLLAGQYYAPKMKLSIPLRRITTSSHANLFFEIFEFLDNLNL